MGVRFGNWQTTAAGAVAGTGMYLQQTGFNLPSNRADWLSFAISLVIAALGLVSKDATVGSKP